MNKLTDHTLKEKTWDRRTKGNMNFMHASQNPFTL